MIHWTYAALRPCAVVFTEFIWGEAAWGFTAGLRRLRLLRFVIILLCFACGGVVTWAIAEQSIKAAGADGYSYYEGKVLEERLEETKRRVSVQQDDIKALYRTMNESTLIIASMQDQIKRQQDMLDAGIKILGVVIVTPILAILWSIFKTGLRKERPTLSQHFKGRRGENSEDLETEL